MPTILVRTVLALSVLAMLSFGQRPKLSLTPDEQAIVQGIRGLRSVPDADRGERTRQLAEQIRKLPPDAAKVSLAAGLAGLSTEGDFGYQTVQAVADTLADALREQPSQPDGVYEELANLIRYEHVEIKLDGPQLSAALSRLAEADHQRSDADFTLNDLDGKGWTLKNLKGHVVVVNFWATWCPPCRKEMPDLNALYREHKKDGLIVLAISDEDQAKVQQFLEQTKVSYPVLLDPGGKVGKLFRIDSLPHTFIYDREGKLAAQAIDMRTRGQFVALLSQAGITSSRP